MRSGALFAINALMNLAFGLALSWVLPAEIYGAFMVCFTVAILISNLVYDWARVALVRFYTGSAGDERGAARRALDFGFLASISCCCLAVGAVSVLGILPNQTLLTAPALLLLSTSHASFEYLTTLCRARFDDASYARMILIRNGVLLGASLPLIAYAGSLDAALVIYALGIAPAVAYGLVRHARRSVGGRFDETHRALPRQAPQGDRRAALRWLNRILAADEPDRLSRIGAYISYSVPLMAAEVVYMLLAVVNRAWLAHTQGAAVAGGYALTFDLAFRVLAVTASIGDVVLFPRLVQRAGKHDREATRGFVARNIAVMALLLLPAATGFALTAPSLGDTVLAERFRDAFETYAPYAAAAGLFYTLQSYALRPAFQMELRSADPLIAACVALAVNCALLVMVRGTGLYVASMAQLAGLLAGLAMLCFRVTWLRLISWPLNEFARIGAASLILAAAVLAVPTFSSSTATVGAKAIAGAVAFAVTAFALNAAGIRELAASLAPTLMPLPWNTDKKNSR